MVDTKAAKYADFVRTRNGARGVSVWKMFQGIFSDPDGDELTYTASVPADQLHLVDGLSIHFDVTVSGGELADFLAITVDGDDDWKAASPALADPLVVTATLTATDPEGLSASLSGDFLVNWDSIPALVSATSDGTAIELTFDQSLESNPAPKPGQFTARVVNGDGSSVAVAVSSVSVNGAVVTLELASPLSAGQTVVLDYAHDDDTPLQRAGGGDPAPGFTGQAVALTVIGPPDSPANLEISSEPGKLDVSATWDAAEGATSYRVSWQRAVPDGQARGFSGAGNAATVSSTSATFTVPDYGRWMVRLQACNDAGCGSATGSQHFVRSGPQAQQNGTATTLISNTGQTEVGQFSVSVGPFGPNRQRVAQTFTTGGNTTGYTLSSVDARLKKIGSNATVQVSIYNTTGGVPGSSLHTLTNPASVTADAVNTFTAASGATLDANTTYAVVIEETSGGTTLAHSVELPVSDSDDEDAGGATGWSIADALSTNNEGSDDWSTEVNNRSLLIAVKGSANDSTPPRLSYMRVDGDTLEVVWNEVLLKDLAAVDRGKPPASAFSVAAASNGSSRGINVTSVVGFVEGNKALQFTLASAVTAAETVTVSYTKPVVNPVRDRAGNEAAGFSNQAAYNITGDTTAPTFSSASVNAKTLTVTFSEELAHWEGTPEGSAFSVTGSTTGTNAGAGTTTISGADVTVTLASAVIGGETVTVSYTGPGTRPLLDPKGNEVADFTNQAVTNNTPADTTQPMFVSAAVNGATLTLTFDEALDTGSAPAGSAFSVGETQARTTRTIAGTGTATVSGMTATVTLATPTTTNRMVWVFHTKPGSNPLQDVAGNDVAGFVREAVNNTPLVSNTGQSVDGDLQVAVTWLAVPFITGSIAGGYTLSEVGLRINSWNNKADRFTAQIYSATTSGTTPDSSLYTLTNPAVPTDGAVNTFKAPAGATLNPSTVYFLVVKSSTGNTVDVSRTTSDDEDSGAAIAWVIGNARVQSYDQGSTWTTNAASVLMFAIRGERTDQTVVDLLDFGGGCTQPGCPGTPINGTAKPGPGHGQITLDWRSAAGSTQTSWRVGHRESGTSDAFSFGTVTDADVGTHTLSDLDVSKTYDVQVQGVNRVNNVDLRGGWARADGVAPLNIPPPPDTTPPDILSAAVNRTTLTVTFDKNLDSTSTPAGSAFSVTGSASGTIAGTATAVTVSDDTVTVTLASAVTDGETVTVTYTKPATNPLRSNVLIEVRDLVDWPATNNTDTTPPTVRHIRADSDRVWVEVDEELFGVGQGVNPPAGSFTVTATPQGGDPRTVTVSSATLFDMRVRVNLSGSVAAGETVTVTYTKPASNPVRDLAGNEMANFTNHPAYNIVGDFTPPTLSEASVNEATLTLTFNEELAQWSTPSGSAFSVTGSISGTIAGTGSAVVSDATATVTLASAVHPNDTVTVTYNRPGTRGTRLRDRAHNEVATFTNQSVTNNTPADTTAPRVSSASVNGTTLKVVFDEALDESAVPLFTPFRYTVDDSQERSAGVTDIKGDTVTVTLASAANVRHGRTVRIAYANPGTSLHDRPLQDLSGNQVATIPRLFKITNNTPPAFKSASVDGAALTVTFDGGLDADSVPAASAFAVTVGGTAVSLAATNPVAVSGSTVTLTLAGAVDNGDTVTVAYTAPGTGAVLQDADNAKNPVPDFAAQTVTNNTPADTTPPTVQYIRATGNRVWVTVDEQLFGVGQGVNPPAGSFTVTATPQGSDPRTITASSATLFDRDVRVDLSASVAAGETVTVTYAKPNSNPVRDLAGNEMANFTNQLAYNTVGDATAPTVSSAAVNAATLTLTFNEELAQWSTPPGNAFTVSATAGGATRTIAGTATAAVSGTTATVTLASAVDPAEAVTVAYTKPSTRATRLRDRAHNEVADITSQTVTNNTPADTTAPTFDSAEVDGRTLTITFDEALDEDSVPSPEDFSVTVSHDIPGVASGGVAISGDTVTLTLQTPTTHNSVDVYVRYTTNASRPLQDLAGNDVTTFKNQRVTNVTATAVAGVLVDFGGGCSDPSCPDAPTGSAMSGAAPGEITVTWTPAATGGAAMRWRVGYRETNRVADFTEVTVAGTARSHTFSNLDAAKTYDVQVQGRGSATTDIGDAAVATGVTPLVDTTSPSFLSAAVNGTTLTVTFDETLDAASAPEGSAFSVTATPQGGSARSIAGTATAAISDTDVTVTLTSAVAAGETVTVSYTAPGTRPLKDSAGNDVANFSNQAVTNNTPPPDFSSASVNGRMLTVTFDRALDAGSAPSGSAFVVTATQGGTTRTIAGTGTSSISGNTATVTLAGAVAHGETVTVSYTRPATNPLQDMAGGEAPSFTDQTVTNNTPDTTSPAFTSATVDGTSLTVTFAEALDPASAPAGTAFRVRATPPSGRARTIAGTGTASISDMTVTVTLANAVASDERVTVTYTSPRANPVQDPSGNAVPNFSNRPVTNATQTALVSARVAGPELILTFNGALDAGTATPGRSFRVTEQGNPVQTIRGTGTASVSGATVTVPLDRSVKFDKTITVSYTSRSSNPLRNFGGVKVPSFNGRLVTSWWNATAFRSTVELRYPRSLNLDVGSVPDAGDFELTLSECRSDSGRYGHCYPGGDWSQRRTLELSDSAYFWSATLTAHSLIGTGLSGCDENFPPGGRCSAALTEDSFTLNGTSYQILSINEGNGRLVLALDRAIPRDLTLYVGNRDFPVAEATLLAGDTAAIWDNHGFAWNEGDEVSLGLLPGDTRPIPVIVEQDRIILTLAEPLEWPWFATSDLLVSYTPGDNPIRYGSNGEATGFTELRLFNDGRHARLPTDRLEREFLVEETVKMFRVGDREHPWYTTQRAQRFSTSVLRVVYILNYFSKEGLLENYGAHDVQPPTETWCAWVIPGNTSQCHHFYPRPWPIVGTSASETLIGGDGNDYIYGLAGNDLISGDDGDDRLIGGNGNDNLQGNDGDDRLIGGPGADTLHGGDGNDTADYSGSTGAVTVNLGSSTYSGGHAEGDTLIRIENIIGSAYVDDLRGNSDNNRLIGGAGSDTMSGAAGNDTLIGGAGEDELLGRTGDDKLDGGDGDDTLVGGDDNDILTGRGGNDVLSGEAGDDTLVGGEGTDTLFGGNGVDVFNFHAGAGNDFIEDYDLGAGEAINVCMGSESNVPTWHADDNDDGNLVITVTLNGKTEARISLIGTSLFAPNIDNLNVVVHTGGGPSCAH